MSAPPSVRARELTPRGAGAVSVVEYAGRDARAHVARLGAHVELAVGDVRLARLRFAHDVVDEALVVCAASDRVEVHLHGGPALVRAALATAEPWADVDGSIERRARAALARATCDAAARILLDQAEGALRRELERWSDLDAAAARAAASTLAERGRRARYALEPAVIVLAGPVNAGKSTLFNVLAGESRALVADEPGTTRDVVAADVLLGAWPARVLDTAGERSLADEDGPRAIEAEGQRRGRRARDVADLVLWLAPARDPLGAVPDSAVSLVTQADRVAAPPAGSVSASADPGGARRRVGEILRARFDLPLDPWRAGEAVPFEPARLDELVRCVRAGTDVRTLARAWLADRD